MSTTETQLEAVRAAVEPVVAALGYDLYDVELSGAGAARTLRVTVTNEDGLDLDAITTVTQAVSPVVDELPIKGSFLLEVSSPGIERTLRRPEHYAGAIGEIVSVKFHTDAGPRRVRGTLHTAGDERIVVTSEDDDHDIEIALAAVTQARTVFEWGPQARPKPGQPKSGQESKRKGKGKGTSKTRARAKGNV